MGKHKISNDELDNVAGGKGHPHQARIACPSCHTNNNYEDANYKDVEGCFSVVHYFRCKYCGYEWSKDGHDD